MELHAKMTKPPKVVYVIPVPDGMTPDEAWHEIRLFGMLLDGKQVTEDGVGGKWAVIEEDDDA